MIKIIDFVVEFLLDRMWEYILMYFVCCTVSAKGSLCSPTIHVASRQAWLSPRFNLYTYICHALYWIYISWSTDVLQGSERRLCFFMILACSLISNKFNQISVFCDSLNSPTLFHKLSVSTWLLELVPPFVLNKHIHPFGISNPKYHCDKNSVTQLLFCLWCRWTDIPSFESSGVLYITPTYTSSMQE